MFDYFSIDPLPQMNLRSLPDKRVLLYFFFFFYQKSILSFILNSVKIWVENWTELLERSRKAIDANCHLVSAHVRKTNDRKISICMMADYF